MGLKISQDRNGDYLLKLDGIRTSIKAKTIKEVHIAIDHYFANHFHDEENCVLCKADKVKSKSH